MSKITLFCVPYAGGSTASFAGWKKFVAGHIDLNPIELSGRGRRLKDRLYDNAIEMTNDIFDKIAVRLSEGPYALFGHSMGAIVVYEMLHLIRDWGLPEPVHVFFSGRYPMHITKPEFHLSHLSDEEFMTQLLELGETPRELFENDELKKVFLPILRADYSVHDNYIARPRDKPLTADISVFNGRSDKEIVAADLDAWASCTRGSCSVYQFDGNHFFINSHTAEVVATINGILGSSRTR